jgi:diadenosine tetraphosphate (Ap4A) HIT family hydrolase
VSILQSAAERILLETATTLAFFDAFPVAEGHALVIPKRHVAFIFDLPAEELSMLWTQVGTVRKPAVGSETTS